MLDDAAILTRRDSERTLETTATQYLQMETPIEILSAENDGRQLTNIVIAGMGGSGLAAQIAKTWLDSDLAVPLEIVQGYSLPGYVDESSLVIISSCSGNTEEVLSNLTDANERGAQVAIITSGGKLAELGEEQSIARVMLVNDQKVQPRMLTFLQLRAIVLLLVHFGLAHSDKSDEIVAVGEWLGEESRNWTMDVTTENNYAKQLALQAVGKTPIFYGGELTWSLAFKWKISWNENSKNVAFWNRYPEFNHNEFIGWTSHPVEKPFAVFDLMSSFEHPQIKRRFEISDRLLSGKRPKVTSIELAGDTLLKQLFWGNVLADYASIYTGVLNNVDPGPVPLITKLKQELG